LFYAKYLIIIKYYYYYGDIPLKIGINSSFIITQFDELIKPKFYLDKIHNNYNAYVGCDQHTLKCEINSESEFDLSEKVFDLINNLNDSFKDIDCELTNKKYYEVDDLDEYDDKFQNAYDFERKFKKYSFIVTNGFLKVTDDLFLKKENIKIFVYLLDLFLGIPFTLIDNEQGQIIRRLYYKCGDYSKYQNTIEYKLLSNNWLFDVKKINLVYQIVEFCFDFLKSEKYKKFYEVENEIIYIYGYDFNELNNIINKLKVDKAGRYMRFINNFLPQNICKDLEKIKAP